MTKLLACDVVKRQEGDLAFTVKFGSYLYSYASCHPAKIGTLMGWRDMLSGFDRALAGLSNDEIAAIVVLLDYHFAETGAAAVVGSS